MKNPLLGAKLYLGGAIECDNGPNWRIEPSRILSEKFGIEITDPTLDLKQQWAPELAEARSRKDFDKMAKIAKSFVWKDLILINKCDILCSFLKKDVPTCGTHHEITYAHSQKMPVLLVGNGKENLPAWYFGVINHKYMFGSWEDLYSYLEEVRDGKHADDKRWAYLYNLI